MNSEDNREGSYWLEEVIGFVAFSLQVTRDGSNRWLLEGTGQLIARLPEPTCGPL
jgi:hypothetical protein